MADTGTPFEQQCEVVEEPVASTSALPDAPHAETVTGETQSLERKDESGKDAPAEGPVLTNGAPKSTLSKSQQRKLARQEKMAALKPERRARERAAKKERKAEKRRLVDEEGADPYEIGLKKQKKPKKAEKFNANIVIDLGFDDKMSEKDIKSMSTQLAHVYNVNRNAVHAVNVILTPLDGQLKERMVVGRKSDYLRWKGIQVYDKPIEELWSSEARPNQVELETQENGTDITQENGTDTTEDNDSAGPQSATTQAKGQQKTGDSRINKDDVIYLTADSKNVLSTLEEGKTYIIGGIVDHNQYKGLCLGLAKKHGIQHAALPISEYVEMASRKVLTVNQCFEIMSKWIDHRDWEKAFYEVIPKRKFDKVKVADTDTPPTPDTDTPATPNVEEQSPEEQEVQPSQVQEA